MSFFRLSCNYIKNGILSVYFFCAVVLFATVMLLSVWSEMSGLSEAAVFYFQRYAYGTTVYFLMILCAVPSALQFSREWKSSFFLFTRSRIGGLRYAFSLVFSAAAVAFAAAFAGGILFLGIAGLKVPFVNDDYSGLVYVIEAYANGGLLDNGNYFLYYCLMDATQALLCALMAGAAVFASTIFTDQFMTAVSPMIIYIVITNFMSIAGVPVIVNPYYVFSTNAYNHEVMNAGESSNFSIESCIYPYIYSLVLLVILAFMVHVYLKRKYERREVG